MSRTLLELAESKSLVSDGLWRNDKLATNRLRALRRQFDGLAKFVLKTSESGLSEAAARVVDFLNHLFAELKSFEEEDVARVLWARLRDADQLREKLRSFAEQLLVIRDEYRRIIRQDEVTIKASEKEITTNWTENFDIATTMDNEYLQRMVDQTSDLVLPAPGEVPLEDLDWRQLQEGWPGHRGHFTFISASSLGRGSYGAVFKGVREGHIVAAKRLTPMSKEMERLPVRLAREFLSMRDLSHPNILPLIGVCASLEPGEPSYLIFPWASQGNARSFVCGRLFLRRLRVISEAFTGLLYLHQKDIGHGDVKGANFLVSGDGNVWVGDFGLSTTSRMGTFSEDFTIQAYIDPEGNMTHTQQYWEETADDYPPEDITLRAVEEEEGGDLTMLAGGTRGWAAPDIDNAAMEYAACDFTESDIYAFGRTIYELMTESDPPSVKPLVRPATCSTGDPFYGSLWDLVQKCTAERSRRATHLEVHHGLDAIWLEHTRAGEFCPTNLDVIHVKATLQHVLHRLAQQVTNLTSIIRRILDLAEYWSRRTVRRLDQGLVNVREVPARLTPDEFRRLRRIRVIGAEKEPIIAVDPGGYLSLWDHQADCSSDARVSIVDVNGRSDFERSVFLSDHIREIIDLEPVRGFDRRMMTYEIDRDVLDPREGELVQVDGYSLIESVTETWAVQMELYFGLPEATN